MKFLRNEDIAYFWKCLSNILNNWESRKYFRVCMSSYFSLSLEHFINYFPTMKYLMSLFNFYYYFCSRAVPLFFLLLLLPFIPIWVMSIESWMWKERGSCYQLRNNGAFHFLIQYELLWFYFFSFSFNEFYLSSSTFMGLMLFTQIGLETIHPQLLLSLSIQWKEKM